MIFEGRRARNLLPEAAGAYRGAEWLYFHNSALWGEFSALGGGYATWVLDCEFFCPVAGWYRMVLDAAPHSQAVVGRTPLYGSAWAGQGRRRQKAVAVKVGDAVVAYFDPGNARVRIQLPIAGDGSGRPTREPEWVPVEEPGEKDIVLLSPEIVPPLAQGKPPKGAAR